MAIAKVDCKCSKCGKWFEVRVKRANRTAADSFEEWAKEAITECYDCRKAAKDAAQKARTSELLERYHAAELVGSPKQIAWVESIRSKALKAWEEELELDEGFLAWLLGHAECRWWIDNRYDMEDAAWLNSQYEEYEATLPAEEPETTEEPALTAEAILDTITADENTIYGCASYGIRADHAGIEPGERLDNSHQWWQDDPSDWGEECEYNEALGMWDGGELPGTCSIGLRDCPTVESIRKAIERASHYGECLYLIRGTGSEGGNDIGESIIYNARCVGLIQ